MIYEDEFTKKYSFPIAVALIICTIIGAGVFGIPYAVAQSGFGYGMLTLVFLGFFVTMMTLYAGEVVLRTKETKQFVGLAKKYMGNTGKYLMLFSIVIGIYGALTAYLTGIGASVANLLGGNPITYSIIFFSLASVAILFGLKLIGKIELILAFALIFTLSIVSISLMPTVEVANLSYLNHAKMFAPYGVILFACLGYPIIPEVEIILKRQKKKMLKAIVIAMVISLIVYAIFAISMLGVYGPDVAEIATGSLTGKIFIFGNLMAIISMSGAFLSMGMVTKHVWHFDLKIPKVFAWALACFMPFAMFLFFSPSFFMALELTGSYAGGLTGILCCIMVKKARKMGNDKPAYVVPGGDLMIGLTALVFAGGIVYQTLVLMGII